MSKNQQDIWQMAGDDVLAVMLADETAWHAVTIIGGLQAAHFATPVQRQMYSAIVQLRRAGKPTDDIALLELSGGVFGMTELATTINLCDPFNRAALQDNIARVREHGQCNLLASYLQAAQKKLTEGATSRATVEYLLQIASHLQSGGALQVDAVALSNELDELLSKPGEPGLQSGIKWLDDTVGGLGVGKLWAIGAPYKGRKTSTALNILVGTLMDAYVNQRPMPSVAFFSSEMTAPELSLQIISMLAAGHLAHSGLLHTLPEKGKIPLGYVTGSALDRAGSGYKQWHTRKVQAIDWARSIFRSVFGKHLRIYDRRVKSGALATFADLSDKMRIDLELHKPALMLVDYVQNFSTGTLKDDDYTRTSVGSRQLQDFAKMHGVTVIALAQQNEEGVQGGKSYSPRIKGGGALASAVDYLILNTYKRDDVTAPDQLGLDLKMSRSSANGQTVVNIHPPSGLILDNTWVKGLSK